jgi:hypothetical protein
MNGEAVVGGNLELVVEVVPEEVGVGLAADEHAVVAQHLGVRQPPVAVLVRRLQQVLHLLLRYFTANTISHVILVDRFDAVGILGYWERGRGFDPSTHICVHEHVYLY